MKRAKYLLKTPKPIIFKEGRGNYLITDKGEKYLDLTAGIYSVNLGYDNVKVTAAAIEQLKSLTHCRTHYGTLVKLKLAEKLSKLSPIRNGKVEFCLHGSVAVEGAIKLALNKKEGTILYLKDAYHGQTFGSASVSWNPKKRAFIPFYGDTLECEKNIEDITNKIIQERPSAIILELIQGNGGTYPLTSSLVKNIRKICNDYNITMIVDEIQTGFGRCGRIFLSDTYQLEPDILVFGKAIANGYPLFGTISKPEYKFEEGDHSFAFTHFPIAIAAGLACIKQLNTNLLKSVLKKGLYLRKRLDNLKYTYPEHLGEVRGVGLFLGIDIIQTGNKPNIKLAEEIKEEMFNKHIIMGISKSTGYGYHIKFKPMLIISYDEIDYVLKVFEKVLIKLVKENM